MMNDNVKGRSGACGTSYHRSMANKRSIQQSKERSRESSTERSKVVAGFTVNQKNIHVTCLIATRGELGMRKEQIAGRQCHISIISQTREDVKKE